MKDAHMMRNAMTSHKIKVVDTTGDINSGKNKWVALIIDYEKFSNNNFVHPFFGKMTKEQIGILAYKHTDHHLRQFGSYKSIYIPVGGIIGLTCDQRK